jgi:CBS domain-containing protein
MHTPLPPDASEPPNSALPNSALTASRALTPALDQPVSMIMTTGDLITADVSEDVAVAIEIFRQGRISHIPVLSEGSKLVGVVSPADILKLSTQLVPPSGTAQQDSPGAPRGPQATVSHGTGPQGTGPKRGRAVTRIADVMTKNIETVRPTVHLRQAAQLFISGGFHSLLVTASDGELLGIVTTSDILRALIGEHVPDSSD